MEDLVKAVKAEVFILGANCCLLFNLRTSIQVILFILEHCNQVFTVLVFVKTGAEEPAGGTVGF